MQVVAAGVEVVTKSPKRLATLEEALEQTDILQVLCKDFQF